MKILLYNAKNHLHMEGYSDEKKKIFTNICNKRKNLTLFTFMKKPRDNDIKKLGI